MERFDSSIIIRRSFSTIGMPQLKQQDGTKAKEEVTDAQRKTAEEFGQLAIDKSLTEMN